MYFLPNEIYLISLDSTIGHEIKKARPCVIISPDEMNKNISTFIIAPLTTQSHFYPTRFPLKFAGKEAWIVLAQLCTVIKVNQRCLAPLVNFLISLG